MRVLELSICIDKKLDVWFQRTYNTKSGILLEISTNTKLDLLKNTSH